MTVAGGQARDEKEESLKEIVFSWVRERGWELWVRSVSERFFRNY